MSKSTVSLLHKLQPRGYAAFADAQEIYCRCSGGWLVNEDIEDEQCRGYSSGKTREGSTRCSLRGYPILPLGDPEILEELAGKRWVSVAFLVQREDRVNNASGRVHLVQRRLI